MMKLVQKIAVAYWRVRFRIMSAISPSLTAKQALRFFSKPKKRTRGPLPPVFADAEKLNFGFSKYRICGFRWNKGQGRRALVIHGFESSIINFDHYIKGLLENGYEVLAFDAPAHGRSSGKRTNALEYSQFLQHIINTYGPMDAYIAHSLGALALCLALAESGCKERSRVALIAPATETASSVDLFFNFLHMKNPIVRVEFDRLITRMTGQPVSWFAIGRTIDHIQCPILWLHDEEDQITPIADAQKIRDRQLPNIRFVISRGLGHNRIYRDSNVRATVLEFLQ